ncbi:MAG: ArsR family transcriptional regulator [Candidatus Thermoplasmatota archaeon]|nr:ArsR family transcriptional regulator [Candidatus Thermoplasmatota archaeon]MBU4071160.1 ArsR family transcriptional regulator [Candidatus Thermoplasmatota archaeon]MBU4145074.1 ArsR family transcriptional regulator [Candidatus Thermoplasmatota archaeon]MBU4591057.1 ArsR family transcriptional regulator [Candidatus Thermoplasmatota archaeon]
MDAIEASKIIADEYAAKILVATFRRPKSAITLSHDLGIPIAACYRRIRMLEGAKLIRCEERILTQKGKRMSVYISNLKNAYIFLEEGKLRVRFEMKSGNVLDYDGNLDMLGIQTSSMI